MAWGGALLLIGLAAGPAAHAPLCLRAVRAIVAGDVAARADLAPADCAGAQPAFGYDRTLRVARARRDIAAGEVVTGVSPQVLSSVRPGDALLLEARVGPVVVQRQVTIVRAAPRGAPVLVRGADGRVFFAPRPEADE